MKNNWLKKFIKQARAVKITAHEKRAMLSRILAPELIPSPYSFFLTIMEHRQKIVVAAVFAVFAVTGGGASFAASNALPGESLYSIKININESIQSFVAVSADAKAKAEVHFTENRLAEAEALSKKGKLDAETKAIIEKKIEEHSVALKENIESLANQNATATVQSVISDLNTSIEAHEAALTTIASSTASSTDVDMQDEHIDSLLQKVGEVKAEFTDLGKKVDQEDKEKNAPSAATSTLAVSDPEATSTAATSTVSVDQHEPVIIMTWTSSSSVSQETLQDER